MVLFYFCCSPLGFLKELRAGHLKSFYSVAINYPDLTVDLEAVHFSASLVYHSNTLIFHFDLYNTLLIDHFNSSILHTSQSDFLKP